MSYKKPRKKEEKKTVQNKEKVTWAFIGPPGKYGKGYKQSTKNDFYKVISNLPYDNAINKGHKGTPFNVYPYKKNLNFISKNALMILLMISIICILLINLILFNIPEFISIGSEIGDLISNLSLAYIASYIFYYLVVIRKEMKTKKKYIL